MEQKESSSKVTITIRLDNDIRKKAEEAAEAKNITLSEFIRQSIEINLNGGFSPENEIIKARKTLQETKKRLEVLTELNQILEDTEKYTQQINKEKEKAANKTYLIKEL